jgi:hypothetical protein
MSDCNGIDRSSQLSPVGVRGLLCSLSRPESVKNKNYPTYSQSAPDHESFTNDHHSVAQADVFRIRSYEVCPDEIYREEARNEQNGPCDEGATMTQAYFPNALICRACAPLFSTPRFHRQLQPHRFGHRN